MAALTADRNTIKSELKHTAAPVAASTKIYAGSLVCRNASGYAVPAADTASFQFIGVSQENVDNSGGANGDVDVLIDRDTPFEIAASGIVAADLLAIVYASDDQTVAKSTTNSIKVGKIVKIDSAASIWVDPKR